YHDRSNRNQGGPHEYLDTVRDVNGGKMNGFIREARRGLRKGCKAFPSSQLCSKRRPPDVMGYHDARELPNYWAYARHFVLQDHMFEPNYGWSLPAHLFKVSGWSAKCTDPTRPMTCTSNLEGPSHGPGSVAERYPHGPLYG